MDNREVRDRALSVGASNSLGLALCFALSFAMLACGGAQLRGPEEGGRAWVELETEHFRLDTDATAGEGRALLDDLEGAYAALEGYAFPFLPAYQGRIQVAFFDQLGDLDLLGGTSQFKGYYTTQLEAFTGQATIAVAGRASRATVRQVLTHELTHRFVHYHMPSAPIWLNEGLAQYYETLVWEGDQLVIGNHPLLARQAELGKSTLLYWALEPNRVLSITELNRLTPREFYQLSPEQSYPSSWAAVDALMEQRWSPILDAYLLALHSGKPTPGDAYQALISSVSEGALLAHQRELIVDRNQGFEVHTIPGFPRPRPAAPSVSVLKPSKVRQLWARLVTSPERALEEAQSAVRLDPSDPESHLVLAGVLATGVEANRAEAVSEMRKSFELGRDAPHYAAGVLLLELTWPGSFPEASAALRVLAKSARTAREYDITARYLLYLGKGSHAERFAMKSVRIDPGRPSSWITLAAVLGDRGKYEAAVRLLTQALALSDHEGASGIVEMIARYEAEAKKPRVRGEAIEQRGAANPGKGINPGEAAPR